MVSKKSIYDGRCDGFQSSFVPKAPRSLRGISHNRSSEGSKLCAFEFLAGVAADKLLQESESSTSSIGQEPEVKVKVNDSGLNNVSDVKSFKKVGNFVKLEPSNSDVDDNSFRRDFRGARMRAFRSRSHAGYRRIRKMLTSRYRNVTLLKDYELTNPTRQIEAASKRRKLFHHSSRNSYEKSGNGNETSNKVKFSIKSFKVPELYIEIPETATIGSLKRTVMEAVRTYLGGKLHVKMHLEGKTVNDNNRSLKQTGISLNRDLDTLGFTLEPSQQPRSCTASSIIDVGFSNCSLDHPPETISLEKVTDSNALVPAVPVNRKPIKKSEVTQCRRIRRPFSVTEVEALVEAVETLGTGRWCDVKSRAFDGADHRTYVDLKNKWKTLVPTTSISAQQRRGEPVPQDLLDRVLATHGYWSNHQVKQRKNQTKPLRVRGG